MYKRYEPCRQQNNNFQADAKRPASQPQQKTGSVNRNFSQTNKNNGASTTYNRNNPHQESQPRKENTIPPPKPAFTHPLTKFLPQSLYNAETGKILGFLSAEDLLLAAVILLLIDDAREDEDNSMLIYALLYVLLSDHFNLPF